MNRAATDGQLNTRRLMVYGAFRTIAAVSDHGAAANAGIHKSKYWEPIFEDSLNLLGKLPGLAAAIYRNTYKDRNLIPLDERYDWAANLAIMMGLDKHDTAAMDMMRMYQTIHAGAPSIPCLPPPLPPPPPFQTLRHALSPPATQLCLLHGRRGSEAVTVVYPHIIAAPMRPRSLWLH